MTALTEFERLEASGVWRADADAQRRDVIVSLGDATLTISDMAERALTHWSLAAIERRGGEGETAVYAPAPDAGEELELDDATMIAAIEQVRRAVARRRPKRGRGRLVVAGTLLLAILALGVFWLPGALVRNAVAVVPEAKRLDIGARLVAELQDFTGPVCSSRLGNQSLAALQSRLRGPRPGRIAVVRDGIDDTLHLPGGIILVNAGLLERREDPDVLAGYIIAEDLRAAARDPLARLLEERGALTAFRLLTTGDIPDEELEEHAATLVSQPAMSLASDALLTEFAAVGLPATPYADALGASDLADQLRAGDAGRDPARGAVLSDEEWIALQSICLG